MKIDVGIIGVTGYAGQELLKLLLRHPQVTVRYLASLRMKKALPSAELLPAFRSDRALRTLSIQPFKLRQALDRCQCFFLALPHGVAMRLAPALLRPPQTRVIDLSGDFRLQSAAVFAQAYGIRHTQPAWIRRSAYGLTEWARETIAQSRLVANPGCYPTAALLALGPLAQAGLLQEKGLIVNAVSGVSGAGRSSKEELLFCEVHEDFRAYKVNAHQHIPEMAQTLRRMAGKPVRLTFVPHLAPFNRGLYATLYAPLKKTVGSRQMHQLYRQKYGDEPFLHCLPEGVWPQLKSVAGTNDCHIGMRSDPKGKRVILFSAIDNLGKGAAGQAVQNMNLIYEWPETDGLKPCPPREGGDPIPPSGGMTRNP